MKFTIQQSSHALMELGLCLVLALTGSAASAQGFSTTTVQGTVYLANGTPGSGTLQISWPAFTTAANQAVAAGRINLTIGSDGYVSANLAPNLGSTPAGLYYTAVLASVLLLILKLALEPDSCPTTRMQACRPQIRGRAFIGTIISDESEPLLMKLGPEFPCLRSFQQRFGDIFANFSVYQ